MVKKFFLMVLSNFLIAIAVAVFIVPHGIILGGATGIAILITHYFNFKLSTIILTVNALLFLAGLFYFGRKFALATIANTVLYPLMMSLLEMFLPAGFITNNVLLSAIFGGVLLGSGAGLILRLGGSSGGTDILALVLSDKFHLNVSIFLYMIDGVILSSQLIFSNAEQILLGIFTLALITLTINKIMLLGKSQIQLFIISDKIEIIKQKILQESDSGITMFLIERAYTERQDKGILCVIPRRKLFAVSEIISSTDAEAFWTISEVNEVRGLRFTF